MLMVRLLPDATVTCMYPGWQRWLKLWVIAVAVLILALQTYSQSQGPVNAQVARVAGTIKAVQAGSVTLTSDTGSEEVAQLAPSTRILRVPPGQKDLKNATPVQADDLQPGDRVLVRGTPAADGHSIAALAVIVMKQADVAAKREHDREDWQKRGVGGLVSATDPTTGNISITTGGFGENRSLVVHTGEETVLRRYLPGSVRFDDAKPAPLDQIKPGDQLWARGTRSEDGGQLAAEEIVSGTFRNIAGTVTAVDQAGNSMTVQGAIPKGTVVVKISPDTQMKKLPPEMARRIAMRLKGSNAEEGGWNPAARNAALSRDRARSGVASQAPRQPGGMQGEHRNGAPDFQRLVSRLPSGTLADLQKGDAVMIVAASRGAGEAVTAVTLLAGVEPILTAAPNQSASMVLSPWTLGSSNGEAAPEP
ncbi:MAG: hypothetical protein DMG70_17530 [Acidobacteria bacterium]|nr:MAG: hypothetical protein DMG70_17530 [Acidobacteriota bacterium]PYY09676.1 MAG: hypothetical protein DMG69_09220 [Acidobacteriota bacterium]